MQTKPINMYIRKKSYLFTLYFALFSNIGIAVAEQARWTCNLPTLDYQKDAYTTLHPATKTMLKQYDGEIAFGYDTEKKVATCTLGRENVTYSATADEEKIEQTIGGTTRYTLYRLADNKSNKKWELRLAVHTNTPDTYIPLYNCEQMSK
jgi:hypothetical protein